MEMPLVSMISRLIRAKASVPHAIIRAELAAPPVEIEATYQISFLCAQSMGYYMETDMLD